MPFVVDLRYGFHGISHLAVQCHVHVIAPLFNGFMFHAQPCNHWYESVVVQGLLAVLPVAIVVFTFYVPLTLHDMYNTTPKV